MATDENLTPDQVHNQTIALDPTYKTFCPSSIPLPLPRGPKDSMILRSES